MADSEKGDSSIKEAKAKTSMLDDDFSKDFLSSWKSMSAAGGDDMDFDFEPVSKGKNKNKNKKFDFGMDMDFSLDDAFGKISSFKIDMPDFDFSSSPKKPTKSKEKTEEDSGKGNHQDKNDKFLFSFDFDGETTAEDSMLTKNKFPGDVNSKFPVAQANIDSGKKELSASEDKGEGSTDIVAANKSKHNERNSDDHPSSCTKELMNPSVLGEKEKIAAAYIDAADAASNSRYDEKKADDSELIKTDSVLENTEKIAAAHTPPRGRADTEYEENRNEMSADTVSLPPHGKEIKNGLPVTHNEKIITNVKSARDADFSLDDTFGKMSTFKLDLPDVNLPTSPGKHTKPKEKSEEDSGKGKSRDKSSSYFNGVPITVTRNKVMEPLNSNFPVAQATTDNGRSELSASEGNGEGLSHIDAADKSYSKCGSGKHKENNSDEDYPSLTTKELSKPDSAVEESQKIAASRVDDVERSYGDNIHKEKYSDEFTSSCTKELTQPDSVVVETEKTAAAAMDGVDSYGDSRHTENKSDDGTSSCTKELNKPDSVLEKSQKIAAAHTPPRDHDGTAHGKQRNVMSVDTALLSVKDAKNGLPSVEHKKMINNVKSSGLKIPSVSPPEQGSKFGNQVQGKPNNKISGIGSIPKLGIGHGNKLSSQSNDKKMLALPTLKVTRAATKDKHPAAPLMQRNVKSPGNAEKSTGLQATIKMAPIVSAEKQTPSTPSLKRKPSEIADMVPAKLHTPKRVSTSENRMSNISVREFEEGAQTQVNNLLEGNRKNKSVEYPNPKFDFSQEATREALQFSMLVENDENVEKAEACAKELDNICNMLKKKHEEAKELLVRALVNNNNLLMLNHPIYEEKIRAVQRLASSLMSKALEVEA